MAIKYIGNTISGVASDTKPTLSANEKGVLFVETDTDKVYQWDTDSWNEITPGDATTSAKGIASFSSGNFSVSSGAVSLNAAQTGITSVGDLDTGSITSGFTSIDVGSGAITTTGTITGGNLSVTGTTTTVNSTNTTIADRLI